MQPQGIILVSEDLGVFLGVVRDPDGSVTGLWSKGTHVSPYMPPVAVAFSTMLDALNVADRLEPPPPGLTFHWVDVTQQEDGTNWATIASIQSAGFGSWLTWDTPTHNQLPI